MAQLNKKQLSKVQRQKAELRKLLWPSLDEKRLWRWSDRGGWLNIPRALPLLLQIMDRMSNGKPVSATYLDLWCRTFDDSFVVIGNKAREMAFFSGFSGERAERTWAIRIRILAELGFIDIKDGPSGSISYVLLWNPYAVIKEHHTKSRVDSRSYNALLERMIEINAHDLQESDPETHKEMDSPTTAATTAAEPAS